MKMRASVLMMPLSTLYRAVTEVRAAAYRGGVFKTSRLPVPVISVGNLTTGGTGKTPLVEWVCRTIGASGKAKAVCVLTRGYGKANPGDQVVVSDGRSILANAREAGDEPFLLANNLLGVASVISNPDRVAAGNWAIENLGADAFVLDDGFQHLRIARNFDIVTIDATNPFGGGELLPTGRLRESPTVLSRAHAIVVTRCDQTDRLETLLHEIRELAGERPVFTSRMQPAGYRDLNGQGVNDQAVSQSSFIAFCGVGNPDSFFKLLKQSGLNLSDTRRYPDHHRYTQSDLDALVRRLPNNGANALITTAKDAVKLQGLTLDVPCYVLDIRIVIDDERRLANMVNSALIKSQE